MPLTAGTRLGPYEIISAIGAGGMGEVYRATDTTLDRAVAVKILPEAFVADAERVTRFEREAKTLASLNHPHIAAIYGFEKSQGVLALVMELVEGEDLSALIARGPISVPDALPIARQIAEALEAAHEAGIVHRDLKPANIKVRADGTVKVLDFGLAKAMDPAGTSSAGNTANSPTLTARATQMGMILGTAAYMAPEQAKGKAVDRRADIWAFGVVVYEMLTGRRLFDAEDISETLAAVLTRDVTLTSMPSEVPPRLRALLRECLVRDPKQRLRDIGHARIQIARIEAGAPDESSTAAPALVPAPARVGVLPLGLLVLGLVAGALGGRWAWPSLPASGDASNDRAIVSQISAAPDLVAAFAQGFALSPDEKTLVYSARRSDGVRLLFKRRLDTALAEPLANTEGAMYPFWAPNSLQVGFWAGSKLQSVPIDGGPARTIANAPGQLTRASWSVGNEILFQDATAVEPRIFKVPASGGQPQEVALDGGGALPIWLADGRRFLFRRGGALYASTIDGKSAPVMIRELDASHPNSYVGYGAGFLVINQANLLSWQGFDETRLALEGPVTPIAERAGGPLGWFAVSVAGRKIVALHTDPMSTLRWVDRSGRDTGPLGQPAQYWTMRLSHDGQRALVNAGGLFTIDRRTNLKTRVTDNNSGIWSADDRDVIVQRSNALWLQPSSGEGQPRQVVASKERRLTPLDASPDGRTILVRAEGVPSAPSLDLLILNLADGTTTPFAVTKYDEEQGSYSPDGRWIAYVANSTGRQEVYARRTDGSAPPVPLSAAGGMHPLWRRDGQELFYMTPTDDIVAVDVGALSRGGQAGQPRTLFRTLLNDFTSYSYPPYAVTPDGQLFLINTPARPDPLTLIQLPRR
jgi:Tol biopolymer transport system component